MSQFPPEPTYPLSIDTDYNLLLVYNTSQTITTANSEPWGDEIAIKPVRANKNEIWADNGFANISGELFYYDAVEKDVNGKVCKFKRCSRNLGGKETKFNPAGALVCGFVVAEHHNTLVDAVVGVEKFVGYNFTPDRETLDWRIRNLRQVPIIFDDFGCPDINFTFDIVSSDPSEGTLAKYKIQVSGNFTQFTLSFGDGVTINSTEAGEHRYAPNSKIDPVVTFTNQQCTIVQTSLQRDSSDQPTPIIIDQVFVLPKIPDIIIPDILIPSFTDVDPDINLPPNLFPCFDFPNIGPINVPSVIILEPPLIIPSFIEVGDIPSFINIFDDLPNISIVTNLPSIIVIVEDIPLDIPVIDDIPIRISVIDDIPISITITEDIPISIALVDDLPLDIPLVDDLPSNVPLVDDLPSHIPITDDIPQVISVVDDVPEIILVDSNLPELIFLQDDVPEIVELVDDVPSRIVVIDDIPYFTVMLDDVPDYIPVFDDIPDFIPVIDDIPIIIEVLDDIPSNIPVNFGSPPCVSVCWGTPPTIPVTVTVSCPSNPSSPSTSIAGMNNAEMLEMINEASDSPFASPDDIQVSYDISGFPSEIKILPPDDIIIRHDIPSEITVQGFKFDPIEFVIPEDLPTFKIEAPDTPLTVETIGFPSEIMVRTADDFPRFIELSVPLEMPVVKLDIGAMPSTITVIGMPSTITIEPIQIDLKAPEFIPISYTGDAIPVSVAVQLELNLNKMMMENSENLQCVAIMPCPK